MEVNVVGLQNRIEENPLTSDEFVAQLPQTNVVEYAQTSNVGIYTVVHTPTNQAFMMCCELIIGGYARFMKYMFELGQDVVKQINQTPITQTTIKLDIDDQLLVVLDALRLYAGKPEDFVVDSVYVVSDTNEHIDVAVWDRAWNYQAMKNAQDNRLSFKMIPYYLDSTMSIVAYLNLFKDTQYVPCFDINDDTDGQYTNFYHVLNDILIDRFKMAWHDVVYNQNISK